LVISILLLGYFNTNNSRKQNATAGLANNTGNALGHQSSSGQQPVSADGAVANNSNPTANVDANGTDATPIIGTTITNNIQSHSILAPVVSINKLPRRTSRRSSVQAIQHINKLQNDRITTQSENSNNRTNNAPVVAQPATVTETDENNKPVDKENNITAIAAQSQIKISSGNVLATSSTVPEANTGTQAEDTDNSPQSSNEKSGNTTAASEQKAVQQAPVINNIDRAWIDDHAFYNKPRRNKLKNRLSWQAYITPSFTYRTLFENSISEGRTSLQSLVTNPFARQAGIENSVDHKPGPSLELGGALVYQLAKKWQLKFGAQVNYTSYYATSNNIQHPITTSIAVNNQFTGSLDLQNRSASISNTPGSNNDKLNNYTVQLALPVGFAYKLAGKDDLKFYFGATVQPSLVLAGNSPLLSSDRLFYVDNNIKQGDASLMRKFNVAMGLETFATFRMGEYTFMAGPQLRYQLLTTNINKYTIGEKQYSMGVKLGVTKKF
jgi:hypothetical protein